MKYYIILLLMLLPIAVFAETTNETKHLNLSAEGIQKLSIDCGAGALKLKGKKGLEAVRVTAEVEVESASEADLQNVIDKQLLLTLKKQNGKAILRSLLVKSATHSPDSRINLTIEIPEKLDVMIKDGSGKISVADLGGQLTIDDDSGKILVKNIVGKVRIGDSSGGITIEEVIGNVEIRDGSGKINVNSVTGNVSVSDGSGGIIIQDIDGGVVVSDGSGSIEINQVTRNVFIREKGSGEVDIDGVDGNVIVRE